LTLSPMQIAAKMCSFQCEQAFAHGKPIAKLHPVHAMCQSKAMTGYTCMEREAMALKVGRARYSTRLSE